MFSSYSKIIRFRKENEKINCYELSEETKNNIRSLLKDTNNIHTLSLDTNEIFFLSDNIILTEGPDDVCGYKKLFTYKGFNPNASFFGWGLGGAGNASKILKMLSDLGYKKIFTILDNDRKEDIKKLENKFPQYSYYAISANDIRNKEMPSNVRDLIKEINVKELNEDTKSEIINLIKEKFPEKEGVFVKLNDSKINEKYEDTINELIKEIEKYFKDEEKLKTEIVEANLVEPLSKNNDEKEAQKLLNEYIRKKPLHTRIKEKYDYIRFNGGSGRPIVLQ